MLELIFYLLVYLWKIYKLGYRFVSDYFCGEILMIAKQQVNALYDKVLKLSYKNTGAILQTINEAERLSMQDPNNTELLILQTHLQIINSQEQRARALANRVWELGGDISLLFEKMYLRDLLNLCMIDMAAILLKNRLENLSENITIFPLEMIVFALELGNAKLLKQICAQNLQNPLFKALYRFAQAYILNDYEQNFANVQKIVLNNVSDLLCAYGFDYYTDRGFTDVEIKLYFSNYETNVKKYQSLLESSIDAYFLSRGEKRIFNLSFTCLNIKDHP